MAYRVRIDGFDGPFDLLLRLVSRRAIDIGSISVAAVADQYLAFMEGMDELDLEVASDFLLVASTLLEIKAASLVSLESDDDVREELETLSASEAREALIGRLLVYKQFKNAAAFFERRFEQCGRRHARTCGPGEEFRDVEPAVLRDVSADDLGGIAALVAGRPRIALLESEHVAEKTIAVADCARRIHRRVRECGHVMFSDIAPACASTDVRVADFLAVLELYKQATVDLAQSGPFADIAIDFVEGSVEPVLGDENEEVA